MIILDIPLSNGIDKRDVKLEVECLRVPVEKEEVTLTTSKSYTVKARQVNHFAGRDYSSATVRTCALLCDDPEALIEEFREYYDIVE
jgi:hypothetical protein